jgi:hypothetical protein
MFLYALKFGECNSSSFISNSIIFFSSSFSFSAIKFPFVSTDSADCMYDWMLLGEGCQVVQI